MPADEEAPLASVLVEVPVDAEVLGAEPGIAVGMPALGMLPDPLEEEDDEDEEEEDDEGEPDDDGDPPAEGMPPEELEDEDVAHPAVMSSVPAAAIRAARRNCAATGRITRFIAAPSGRARSEICVGGSIPSCVSPESGLPKLNGT